MPSPGPLFTTVGQDQDGLGVIPPDTGGAVSQSFILTTVNSFLNVKNRQGALLLARNQDDFWAPVLSPGGFSFDPHSFFDPFGQRFVLTAASNFGDAATAQLLVAVTQTADPTGAWNLFAFPADPNRQHVLDFAGRPGFNSKWIVIGGTLESASDVFEGLWVFDKAALYGGTARFKFFNLGIGINPQIAETYDPTFPDEFFVQQLSGVPFQLFRVSGPVGGESISSVAVVSSPIPVGDGTVSMPGAPSVTFAGPGLVQDCVFRNGSIWVSASVMPADSPLRSAVQWVRMDTTGSVQSFGRLDDATGQSMFLMPSIAVNRNNNFLLGFTRFATNSFPSAAYALNAAGDAPGTVRDPFVYLPGQATYPLNRWGDFSRAQPDPVDDTNFWTVQEATDSAAEWVTAWAEVPAAPQVCPAVPTSPKLDLKARCSSQTTQSEDFSVRVFNWDSAPVTIGSLCIRAWAFEPVPLNMFQWNITAGRICSPGGTSCRNINVTGPTAVRASFPTCTADPTHEANQMVTYCNTSTLTIPPNGGFWEPQGDAFRFGRNNPTMQNGNFADDYSHFGTGNGDCGAFSTPADTRFFALLFNGTLVGESLSPTVADPNTGRLPCTCQ